MKNRPRTCVACRGKFDKNLLFKVVRICGEGAKTLRFDPAVKLQGRGAWVCKKKECIEKARKNRAFERALKERALENVYEELLCAAQKKFFPF